MNEISWKRLLSQIRDGYVVPVIGSRLLVGEDGRESLQRRIAERLLKVHDFQSDAESLPPFHELNEAVSLLKAGTSLQDLYADIHDALLELTEDDAVIPAPIRQLAEISGFRLLVTLTPDDMLVRCLRKRCAVNEIVHSPKLPTSEARDLPADWQTRTGEVQLLYLFGKSSSAPMFAIHDEDLLEYAHNVITRGSHVPIRFLNELQERSLLLIGCNFPDWLSRFFLRVTSKNRLAEKSKREWLIEQLQPEESLTCFLRSFCKDTEVLSQNSPVDFVAELHLRWMAERVDPQMEQGIGNGKKPPPSGVMFFISYSRCTDLLRAEAMVQALLKLGVDKNEIWFDRTDIEPGNDFQQCILDGIRCCRYFLPLLSLSANRREEAFVFREWREANDRLKGMNRDFVIPVVVDTDFEPGRYTADAVRDWKPLHFGFAPDGVPDGPTSEKLVALVREARGRKEVSEP